MNKNLFRKIVCLVIALLMMIPVMPSNLVKAEEVEPGFLIEGDESSDTSPEVYLGDESKSSVTSESAIQMMMPMAAPTNYEAEVMIASGKSTNGHLVGNYAWLNPNGDLYVALAITGTVKGKTLSNLLYNNNKLFGGNPKDSSTWPVLGDDYLYETELIINNDSKGTGGTGGWMVVNLGQQNLTDPFTIGIDYTENGFDALDEKALTINLLDRTVTYNPNGGSGTVTDNNNPYSEGETVTVLANSFTRTGYYFSGWNTAANGSGIPYTAGATFTMPDHDVVLYAQWSQTIPVIVRANSGGSVYNGTVQTVTGYEQPVIGLLEGHVLSGISASGSGTNAGTYMVTFTGTPVIMNGSVNVTSEYNITLVTGTLTISKRPIEITAATDSKVYNGTPLTNSGWERTNGTMAGSETITNVTVTGSQTAVGSSPNVASGADISGNGAGNYQITYVNGTLTVTEATGEQLVVTGYNEVYDATAHSIEVTNTVDGDTLYYSLTNNGEDWSTTKPMFTNATPETTVYVKAVNDNYAERTGSNTVTITKRPIEITAATDSKVYNGTPLTNSGWERTDGTMAGSETITNVMVIGSQTVVGSSPNVASGAVISGNGTGNYEITYVNGTLTITQNTDAIVITADDGTWTYDGQSHSKGTFTTTGVPTGYTVEAVITGSIKDFGTEDNVVTSYVIKLEGIDVTNQFSDITTVDGTLTLNKRPVTLTSESASKAYDGTPVTRPTVTITGDGFVEGEATAAATGTITSVGSVTNTIVITAGTNYKETNYAITKQEGTLTITPKAVVVKADDKSKIRSGSEPVLTATVTGLIEGESVTLISYTLSREKGEAEGEYAITPTGNSVQGNYTVTYETGTMTITRRPGGGGTIITDPEVPLAQLEKLDHFAYVIGYPDGNVKPQDNITREEVAMIFYRLLTDDSRNEVLSDTNQFTDIMPERWSNRAISTLYNAGIIKGYPDGTFKPSDPITRAEFATIAAKFDKLELQNTSKFSDIFGHWAEKYITSSEIKGWIKGYPDMTFKPEKDITRAEAMTLINNVLERVVPEENIHPNAMFWPDIDSDDWYYEAVMEATNSHDYIYEEDKDELWTGMKPNKVWP